MTINVLITAIGCPGGPSIISALRVHGSIKLIGCDINNNIPGRYLVEKYYSVPDGRSDLYLDKIIEIIKKENINIILPLATFEIESLSLHKDKIEQFGAQVLVSDYNSIHIANNKYQLYEYFQDSSFIPKYKKISSYKDFYDDAVSFGYPENKVVIKPFIGHGSRGVRVIDSLHDRYESFINDKPGSLFMHINDMCKILYKKDTSNMLISEYLPGREFGVDLFVNPHTKKVVTGIVRDNGVVTHSSVDSGRIVEYQELYLLASKIVEDLGLIYTVNLDFKMNKDGVPILMEINPRLPATCFLAVISGVNFPLLSVNYALGVNMNDDFKINKNLKIYSYRGFYVIDKHNKVVSSV